MKRTATAVMLTATILMGGGILASPPVEASATTTVKQSTTYTTTDALNLRAGNSTKYKVLKTIPKGKQVQYISTQGSWYKVKYGKHTGYVSKSYIKVQKASDFKPPATPNASSTKRYATTSNLNLRSTNSTKGKIVTVIPKGKVVSYISAHGSWYKVKYGTKTGYVAKSYLKAISTKPVSSPPQPPKPPANPKTPPTGGQVSLGSFYTIDSLNMRKGAGVEHSLITEIPKGEKVEHLATSGNWYQVQYKTHKGWVNSGYLSKTQLVDTEPNASIKWLESEATKRTNTLLSQMKQTTLKDPFLMPVQGRLTSSYGIRSNPTGAGYEFHTGVDYANVMGTPILATADAMVDRVISSATGYGKYIVLRHDMKGMTFYSLYGHLNKMNVVPGQIVKRGEKIGELGSTGRSTGPHLHFEIQNSSRQNVNPQTLLAY